MADREEHAQLQRSFLQEIRRQASAPSLPRLMAWLAQAIDGHVTLTTSHGTALATSSPRAQKALAPAADLISRVAKGALSSAVLDDPGFKARVLAIGPEAPHTVLATARTTPYPPPAAEAALHVADLLAILLPKLNLDSGWLRLHRAATNVHVATEQLLLSGQATSARRAAASLAPHALADTIRVCIVDCTTADREYTADLIKAEARTPSTPGIIMPTPEHALLDGALLAPCPAYDSHLIVIAPAHHDPAAATREPIDALLRRVTAQLEGHYVGISEAAPLTHTGDAYRDAARALSVAHQMPDRVWQYNGHAEITGMIEQQEAYQWAATFLRPLINLPHAERDQMFTALRLALAFPAMKVAKVLDVHRNTVTSRVKRAADLLQLDLSDVQTTAVLDLALQIDAITPADHEQGAPKGPIRLRDVLSTQAAKAWAEMTLTPLLSGDRDLKNTLRAWVAHNANADCAAEELGMHPQTVRKHLRRAEQLLQRPLLAGASGGHDIVIALYITGVIPNTPHGCGIPHSGFFDRLRDTDTMTGLPLAG